MFDSPYLLFAIPWGQNLDLGHSDLHRPVFKLYCSMWRAVLPFDS